MEEKDPIQQVLERHGIKDAFEFLTGEGANPPLDHTPRIDGVPIARRNQLEEMQRRIAELKHL